MARGVARRVAAAGYGGGMGREVWMSERRRVRLFRSGGNQAVRIAVVFALPGDEAILHRDGDRLVI